MKTLRGTGLRLLPVTRAAAPASRNSASGGRLRSLRPAPLVGTENGVSFAPGHGAMKRAEGATVVGTRARLLPVTRAAAPASRNSASWRRLRSLPPAPLVGTEKAVSFAPIHAAMKTAKATTVVDTPASDRAAGAVSSCAAPAVVTLMTS